MSAAGSARKSSSIAEETVCALGGEEDRPPSQMDRGAHRVLPLRRARPRSRHARRARARRQRQDQGFARAHDRQSRRLYVDVLVVGPDLSLRDAAVGAIRYSEHLLRGRRGLHQHRAGRRLSGRRSAGSLLRGRTPHGGRRARDRTRSGRIPPHELHQVLPASDASHHDLRRGRTLPARSTRRSTLADYKGIGPRKAASAAKGKLRGVGFSAYIEACGIAPVGGGRLARRRRRTLGVGGSEGQSDRHGRGPDRLP